MISPPHDIPPSVENLALTLVRLTGVCDPPCTRLPVAGQDATVFLQPGSGSAPTSSAPDHVSPPSVDTIRAAQWATVGSVQCVAVTRRATNTRVPSVPVSATEPSPVPGKKLDDSFQLSPSSSDKRTCDMRGPLWVLWYPGTTSRPLCGPAAMRIPLPPPPAVRCSHSPCTCSVEWQRYTPLVCVRQSFTKRERHTQQRLVATKSKRRGHLQSTRKRKQKRLGRA